MLPIRHDNREWRQTCEVNGLKLTLTQTRALVDSRLRTSAFIEFPPVVSVSQLPRPLRVSRCCAFYKGASLRQLILRLAVQLGTFYVIIIIHKGLPCILGREFRGAISGINRWLLHQSSEKLTAYTNWCGLRVIFCRRYSDMKFVKSCYNRIYKMIVVCSIIALYLIYVWQE